ncbi:DUF6339 family protein [Stenotrophomonas maltophilia]|uniref:DUF6339 family protein n=1 Tax=Stenotrophomonas maltophilia TaxID=40324 RepID=UPI002ACC7A64|nr:DUF6339 family protein [Stenotrophomonas maltophilia]MDZ5791431.1 DUF6339 family protein [Stenotrophomonas maltophilia]
MSKLLYVGEQVAGDLRGSVTENLDRYRAGDFLDLESAGNWRIPLSVDAELSELSKLATDGTPASEIQNSLIVGHALGHISPSIARENRLWVRMSHVEGLRYSRARWISDDSTEEKCAADIITHFFAPTLTACRDDHAISRLWWNYHIARQIDSENIGSVLRHILHRADIRLNFIERSAMASRPSFSRGVVRLLATEKGLLEDEKLFREFMKQMNLDGAGLAFEVIPEVRIDALMRRCLEKVGSVAG